MDDLSLDSETGPEMKAIEGVRIAVEGCVRCFLKTQLTRLPVRQTNLGDRAMELCMPYMPP